MLESSRMMGSGARIPLKFDPAVKVRGGPQGVGGVGLFPGAIVALNGKNGGGGWFLVDEVLAVRCFLRVIRLIYVLMNIQMPPLSSSSASSDAIITGDTSFSMCIAGGPFTPDADLSYKPWHTLLDTIKTTKPAVLLLVSFQYYISRPYCHLTSQRPCKDRTLHRYCAYSHKERRHRLNTCTSIS